MEERPPHDFLYIPESNPQYGFKPYDIDFSHPGWLHLQASVSGVSTALVDNTTLRNALIVMREGLSDEELKNALLLPDLSTVFFAYGYFDNVVLLDQGLLDGERSAVASIFPEITIVRWSDIAGIRDANNRALFDVHHLQLTAIMEEFFKWPTMHGSWAGLWSKVYRANVRPINFRTDSDIDALLNSPAGKLTEAWTQEKDTETRAILAPLRYIVPAWSRKLKTPDRILSALASYHTYRSIFYFCLADEFKWSYLPCGVRGIATDALPLDVLPREHEQGEAGEGRANHILNPLYTQITLSLARGLVRRDQKYLRQIEQLRVQLPIMRLNPTLVALLSQLAEFEENVRIGLEHPTWNILAREWRADFAATRLQLQRWTTALEQDPFNSTPLTEMGKSLSVQKLSGDTAASAVCVAAGTGALLSGNPMAQKLGEKPFVEGLMGLMRSAPQFWECVSTLGFRRRLRFLLRSRELAGNVLGADEICHFVWGRRLSEFERRYLEELQQLSPIYGI